MEENLLQPQVPVSPVPVTPTPAPAPSVPPTQPPPPKRFPLKWILIIALLAGIVLAGTFLIFQSQSGFFLGQPNDVVKTNETIRIGEYKVLAKDGWEELEYISAREAKNAKEILMVFSQFYPEYTDKNKEMYIKEIVVSGDTAEVYFGGDEGWLTDRMGSAVPYNYSGLVTFALTEGSGIKKVDFKLQSAGTHFSPGISTREDFIELWPTELLEKNVSQGNKQVQESLQFRKTSNWKIYTNTKHHFSVKYPQDFSIVRGPGEDAKTYQDYQDVNQVGFISSSKLTHFKIYIDPKNPGILTSPTSVTKTILGQNVEGKENKQTYQEVSPNRITTQLSQDFSVVQNGKEYLVSFSTTTYSPEELSFATETFDQFLSTFKFIEITPSPTCRPRPACLDAKPITCLITVTADMCPPAEAKFCGGIANIECPSGYTCKLDGFYPDAGGKCVKE